MLPNEVLPAILASDPAAPRVTYYDDTNETTRGERIELSGKVLANWVAKAGNLLLEEFDAEPGTVVALDLPPEHWRTLYWVLATWATGATVTTAPEEADIVISTRPDAASPARLILVTLAALARSHPDAAPEGSIDEAADVATYDDVLGVADAPDASDVALHVDDRTWSFGDVVPGDIPSGRRLVRGDLEQVARCALGSWASGGSVLLCRGADEATLADRLRVEEVNA